MKHRSSSHRAIAAQSIAGGIAAKEGQGNAAVLQASSPGTPAGSPAAGAGTRATS